jgi:hypothetical protein
MPASFSFVRHTHETFGRAADTGALKVIIAA